MQQEVDRAIARVNQAIERSNAATNSLFASVRILMRLQSSAEAERRVSEVRHKIPQFSSASEELQRAYSALFSVPVFAVPELRPQVRDLRLVLEVAHQNAILMRESLQGFLDDLEELYESPALRRAIADVLPSVIEQWDLHSRRVSAILNVIDERLVPLEDTPQEPPVLLPDRPTHWRDHIDLNPKILAGKPVIKGTRISVQLVLDLFSVGWTEDQLLESYPHLTREGIRAAFAYASGRLSTKPSHAATG